MQLRASCSHFWSTAESVVEVWRNTRRKLNLFFAPGKLFWSVLFGSRVAGICALTRDTFLFLRAS